MHRGASGWLRAEGGVSDPRGASLWLVLLFALTYGVIARVSFRAFPFSGDEYSNELQAEIFARGSLSVPAPPHAKLFWVDHVVMDDRVRSKYPPGASALLALGVLVGLPWLVTPLEGALTLLCLRWAARSAWDDRAALVAVFVAGTSPLFMFNAASFYSHAAVCLWLALALAALVHHRRDPRRRWPVLAGLSIGAAFLTRPFDALVFAACLPLLGRWRQILPWAALGGLPAVAATLLYQKAQFGGPFVDGYSVYEPTFRMIYGARGASPNLRLAYVVDPDQSWQHFERLRALLVDWIAPGAVFVAMTGLALLSRGPGEQRSLRNFLVGLVVAPALAFLPTWIMADDGPNTRYLSTMIVPIALLAGPGWAEVERRVAELLGEDGGRAVALFSAALAVVMFVSVASARLPAVFQREGLYRAVRGLHLHDAVVVVKAGNPTRYTRNGPTFDGSVLYVRPDEASRAELSSWFPGRSLYEAHEGWIWKVDPLAER
ncbi:MAG: glycosyltransferase family 39 protein [Myxococcales bacterium]|nr:glycosyltransferase family 39 protein [Myxococcales bacterium]